MRKQEEQHAARGQIRGYWVSLDPIPGLVGRVKEKVSKSYELTGADEFWLVIFAGVPQWGAVTSTFLFPLSLDCQRLSALTASLLQNSGFGRCYIFCELADRGVSTWLD